jgi:hypothetical protein
MLECHEIGENKKTLMEYDALDSKAEYHDLLEAEVVT